MDEEDMVHIHNGILLSHKKNEILDFAIRCMYLESIRLSEISETEKDKHCILTLTVESKKQINVYNNTETDSDIENKPVVTNGERGGAS